MSKAKEDGPPDNIALRLFADRKHWSRNVEFLLSTHVHLGKKYIACPIEMKEWPEMTAGNVSFEMTPEDVQELMDNLWALGIRPSEFELSKEKTAAMGVHLEDMRAIAFDKLKIEKP